MIDAAEYEFIRQLVYDRSRINLGPDKVDLVCSRLRKRARALQLDGLDSYINLLRSPAGEDELTGLLDVISTNVTEFFREADHFEYLRQTVLPEWQASKARASGAPFRVWSAACSSGEEPYTLAITLSEFFRQTSGSWAVVASDISTQVLERAQAGVYPGNRIKLPDSELLRRYFQKGEGNYDGFYRVKSSLRNQISFRHLNLFDTPYPFSERFEVIFCRNVMIYFDRPTQEALVPRLREQLVPGGYLFVGHSESLIGIDHALKCVRPSIYRRAPGG